jgi:uncharacterized protein (DUF736 family)
MSDKDKEKNEWDDREVGALWVNQKQDGTKYLTGTMNGEKVIVFKNKYKEENAKAPDFRIYKQKPQGESSSAAPEPKVVEEPDLI